MRTTTITTTRTREETLPRIQWVLIPITFLFQTQPAIVIAMELAIIQTMEMDMAKNNDDTVTPSMETMKAMMMKKDEMEKSETASKRMNAMKDANPMYAMKDAAQKEMMNAMKKVQMNDKKKIQATYEKYLVTKEGSLEAAVLTSVSTKKTD